MSPLSLRRSASALLLASFTLALACAPARAGDVEPGFRSLFNGRDLAGWEGNPAIWSVRDGAITGETKADPKLAHNTFLVLAKERPADFELRLSYRILGGNSGVQYRSQVKEQGACGPIVGGYQADIDSGKNHTGILYEERGRGILVRRGQVAVIRGGAPKPAIEVTGSLGAPEELQAKIRQQDWNEYVIIARGNRLQHSINGVPMMEATDEQADKAAGEGVIALQVHVGPPMVVQFRDIRIRPLP